MVNSNLIVNNEPKSHTAESFKTLRTNIEFTSMGKTKIILITSSMMGEGKSFISTNLAIAFAQQDKKVLLIDTDLRRGVQHNNLDIKNDMGLSNYLANPKLDLNRIVNATQIKNLYIITRGDVPPNPSELLSTDRMKNLIETVREDYDIVILDAPPALGITDSLILTTLVDTTIIVSAYKKTKRDDLKHAQKAIETVGGKIGGVILNQVDMKKDTYGYYGRYSYYYAEDGEKKKKKC